MKISNSGKIKSIFAICVASILLAAVYFTFLPTLIVEARPQMQDSTVQFNTSSITQDELSADTTFNLTVQISPVPTGTTVVTVTYSTGNGTALSGFDYAAVTNEIITFTASTGATKTIPITVLADDLNEESENFFVQLKNAINANLGANSVMVVTIPENDPLDTPTPTQSAATPIYIDIYEGNDTIQTAYSLDTVNSGNCVVENATFWPAGDVDYYRFWAQASAEYTLTSTDLSAGLDTILTLYNPEGEQTQLNDDSSPGARNSTITFTPSRDAWYYFSLINEDPSNPAGKTYCVEISETSPTVTPSPTIAPTFAPNAAVDACATAVGFTDNDIAENACVISANSTTQANFMPRESDIRDIDYYRVWIKENNFYTCDTLELSEFNDTNLKFINQNFELIAENDDADATTAGSQVSFLGNYTGWMYVFVEPKVPVEFRIADKYTYSLTCAAELATPTPTPRPTQVASVGTGGGNTNPPTPTPTPPQTVTAVPTIDLLATLTVLQPPTPTPTVRPNIVINPLPTMPPPVTPVFATDLQVVLFYDRNLNNLPEIDEGIVDMAVLAKNGTTGELLALGYTNEAGLLRFQVGLQSQSIIIAIPYLGIEQTLPVTTNELLIRVSPSVLPSSLP